MLLEEVRAPKINPWIQDGLILLVWLVWALVVRSFELAQWMQISALPVLVVFGCWFWSLFRGAFLLLLVSWLYASISFAPSGLVWLSLFISFVIIKFWQLRFFIQGPGQFSLACGLAALFIYSLQFFFYKASSSTLMLSYGLGGTILALAIGNALLGFLVHGFLRHLVSEE